jgi:hypothetical protein
MGDRFFNAHYFSKSELNHYLSTHPTVGKFIPETQTEITAESIKQMLDNYSHVYVKPHHGSHGKGIKVATKTKDGNYRFVNRRNKETIVDESELSSYVKKLGRRKYLIQQGVSSTYDSNKKIDFRAYLQKNYHKKWVVQGTSGRIGKTDSIVTNLKFSDKILEGNQAIKNMFNLDEDQVKHIEDRIATACLQVCEALDECVGNYGDVAIDFVIDKEFNIWILEINKRYNYKGFGELKDGDKLFSKILTTTLEYAKALAGF